MKGIYLTQKGKEEIEAKIAELEKENKFPIDKWEEGKNQGKIYILEEILESATILPVEESWEDVLIETLATGNYNISYPSGVIIQPKQ
jgi:hypothetical protein